MFTFVMFIESLRTIWNSLLFVTPNVLNLLLTKGNIWIICIALNIYMLSSIICMGCI